MFVLSFFALSITKKTVKVVLILFYSNENLRTLLKMNFKTEILSFIMQRMVKLGVVYGRNRTQCILDKFVFCFFKI